MFEVRERPQLVERALLVGVYLDRRDEAEAASLLEELHELVETLEIGIVDSLLIFARDPNKRFLMGSGKAREVMAHAAQLDCDCIVFDNELLPLQQRAWEEESGILVIDRQEVILDIFNMRARTKEARLQVQLARMEYSLPRLARMWGHLDRQAGGGGGGRSGGATRGEGEKQVEIDRRLARKRMDRMREELAVVRKQRDTERKGRRQSAVPHAAIVGYTNAGKSSLLNALSGSEVLAQDKLFATLDPTTRRVALPDGQPLLLTDTVGFVRRLPHGLVEAFKATLEEAVLADFLLHILDASSPDVFEHYETTRKVLAELGSEEKPVIIVLNKIDLIDDEQQEHRLREQFGEAAALISVLEGTGVGELLHRMNEMLLTRVQRMELFLPLDRMDLVASLHRDGKVIHEEYRQDGVDIVAIVPQPVAARLKEFERSSSTCADEVPPAV
jgi:GTP-binding protein HflX